MFAFAYLFLLGFLVVFQGGYYINTVLVAGAIGCVFAAMSIIVSIKLQRPLRPLLTAAPLVTLALILLLSGVVNGFNATGAAEACTWLALCPVVALCALMDAQERTLVLKGIFWLGFVSSIAGMLMYLGLLPFPGSMSLGRLQFTFQYANTAGVWFGVVALVTWGLFRRKGAKALLVIPPVAALLLTQSIGAILVFVCIFGSWTVFSLRRKPVLLVVFGVLLMLFAFGCAAVLVSIGRIPRAILTFAERLDQIKDAMTLIVYSPLLGIGPDAWRYCYPSIQTTEYDAVTVHCGYAQLALDGGLIALACFLAFISLGVVHAVKRKDATSLSVIALIVLHALFDIDLQFSAILVLLAFFIRMNNVQGEASE